jgi:hypothetical protein
VSNYSKLRYAFDIDLLKKECYSLIDEIGLHAETNQISLKHTCQIADRNLWYEGVGSFKKEFNLKATQQKDFTELNKALVGTYLSQVYKEITKEYDVGRFRIMGLPGQKCMTLHYDITKRIHVPLETNEDCLMIIDNEVIHMPADGSAYLTNTFKRHTALNANWDFMRLHLVFDLL